MDTTAKKQPIQRPPWRTVQVINLLLENYNENADFVDDLSKLRDNHSRILQAVIEKGVVRDPGQREHSTYEAIAESADRRAQAYVRDLTNFADAWGLRAPWAGEVIHQSLELAERTGNDMVRFPAFSNRLAPPPPCPLSATTTWDRAAGETFDEAASRLMDQARVQERDYLARYRRYFERTTALEQHVGWLYRRIVPPAPRLIALARELGVHVTTLRAAIDPLFLRLHLAKPPVRVGRPTKAA